MGRARLGGVVNERGEQRGEEGRGRERGSES